MSKPLTLETVCKAGSKMTHDTEARIAASEESLTSHPYLDPYRVQFITQFWDTANTNTQQSDFWVCETWATAYDGHYLWDVYQGKHEFPDGVMKMEELFRNPVPIPDASGKPILISPKTVWVESTGVNNGAACVQSLLLKQPRIPAIEHHPGQASKEERADVAIQAMRSEDRGPFFFPEEAKHFRGCSPAEFYAQHTEFPNGVHDDLVDTTSMAVAKLMYYVIPERSGLEGTRTAVNLRGRRDSTGGGSSAPQSGGSKTPRQFTRSAGGLRRGKFNR